MLIRNRPTDIGDQISRHSDALVLQLERMGGIVVGKTNVPEFGAGSNTFNEIFPTTLNPLPGCEGLTAGGSSGGSAAALGAKQVRAIPLPEPDNFFTTRF